MKTPSTTPIKPSASESAGLQMGLGGRERERDSETEREREIASLQRHKGKRQVKGKVGMGSESMTYKTLVPPNVIC